MKKLLIVLPAFNEEKVIDSVLLELKKEIKKIKELLSEIVVVDDGSSDRTSSLAKKMGVTVLRHPLNRGLGGALLTGFKYARLRGVDFLVTMDSDGQHDPHDLKKIIKVLQTGKTDVVIGKREISQMPFDRKIITLLSSFLTFLFFGIWSSDTQSGFRGFNKRAIEKIKIKTQQMEVSSEIFSEIKENNLSFVEIPIKVIYTSYSRQKGQNNLNALNVLFKLFLRLAR